jgi:hypothetical protein
MQQQPSSSPQEQQATSQASGEVPSPSNNGGDYIDLHEVAKGWKAAIARAKDPATRYVGVLPFLLLCGAVLGAGGSAVARGWFLHGCCDWLRWSDGSAGTSPAGV